MCWFEDVGMINPKPQILECSLLNFCTNLFMCFVESLCSSFEMKSCSIGATDAGLSFFILRESAGKIELKI